MNVKLTNDQIEILKDAARVKANIEKFTAQLEALKGPLFEIVEGAGGKVIIEDAAFSSRTREILSFPADVEAVRQQLKQAEKSAKADGRTELKSATPYVVIELAS